jgi:hypothetical protein
MPQIIVDETLHQKLLQILQPVELVDAGGQVLGRFVPETSRYHLDPNISDEELGRREEAGGGRSLGEIISDLERRL